MERGIFDSPVVRVVNTGVTRLLDLPVVGRLMGRNMATVRYVGRRSGKTFELPVGYRRSGDEITIGVQFPDKKKWWRNFLGEGGPITVQLGGADRAGHAKASRDSQGRVAVTVQLDKP